jgi:replicative DNA helicase
MTTDLCIPPHSLEAEQAILGGLLMQSDSFDRIDWLSEADFFSVDHRLIYAAIRSMTEAGKPIDVLLLADHLRSLGELEDAGGMAYIGSLAVNTPSAANIHRYAEVVREKSLRRQLMALGCDIQTDAAAPGTVPMELVERAESRLADITHGREESEPLEFHHALDAALLARQQAAKGLRTGFVDLDSMIKPLKGGDLVVIAGRPSMGKSGLAVCVAEHVARASHVGLWSLEMSRAAIAERILGWHERRDQEAAGALATLGLHIDTPNALSVGSLRLRMKRLRRKHGLSLAVVDYLGLMRGDGENRTQQIGSVSRGLKGLAVEFDIPVIAVCQLNRGNENRVDRRPMLSDLRDSGDVEQDADIVLMLYRDEYYDRNSQAAGTAEVLIRKHRNGPTGMVRLAFIDQHARFENYAGPQINTQPPTSRLRAVSGFDYKAAQSGEADQRTGAERWPNLKKEK